MVIARAEGSYLYEDNGRRYLDFISGIAVTNVGHCHPRVVRAVQHQAASYAHTMVYGEHVQQAQVELAVEIARIAPEGLDTTYFLTTGAEANDAAIKMAAKLTGRRGFVAFNGAYHGDTIGAMACFGDLEFRKPFQQVLGDVTFLPFGNLNSLQKIDRSVAGVLVEPVQGEAGIRPPPDRFLQELRDVCSEVGALLIFDEVQTGFGRTGNWFAAQTYGVIPDVITIAKGMGAGMPLAGVLGSHDQMNAFAADPPFSHITTFGGHPVSCAAALAGLHIVEEEQLLENTRKRGSELLATLQQLATQHAAITAVRGVGLMIGVELNDQALARRMVIKARELGVIFETTLLDERVIRFSPPLNVTDNQCEEALHVFEQALIAG